MFPRKRIPRAWSALTVRSDGFAILDLEHVLELFFVQYGGEFDVGLQPIHAFLLFGIVCEGVLQLREKLWGEELGHLCPINLLGPDLTC
jgi:hypothetical protein